MNKAKERYNVIQEGTVYESNKEPGTYIIKNKAGKIFFHDSRSLNGFDDSLVNGSKILFWVTKELINTGFARVTVNNILVRDYIESLKNIDVNTFINKTFDREEMFLSNNFYNSDIEFKKYLESSNRVTQEPFIGIDKYFKKYGINSEEDEFKCDLSMLHDYLYNKYSVNSELYHNHR